MGQDVSWQTIVGGTVGSISAGRIMGNFSGSKAPRLVNVADELLHAGFSGMLSAGIGGVTTNLLHKRNMFENLEANMRYGFAGGVSTGFANVATMGGAVAPPEGIDRRVLRSAAESQDVRHMPVYRSGGFYGTVLTHIGASKGFAGFGRNILVNQIDEVAENQPYYNEYLWFHETAHYWQQVRSGWAGVIGSLAWEHITGQTYDTYGSYENRADMMAWILGTTYGRAW